MIPRWGHDGVISGWLQVFSFPLWEPDTQLSKGVIKYLRDITKEKEAETSFEAGKSGPPMPESLQRSLG